MPIPFFKDPAPVRQPREIEDAVSIALSSFSECFKGLCPKIEDELFAQAERESDHTRQTRILDAYGLVRSNRERIEAAFRRALEQIIRQRLSSANQQAADRARATLDQLQLVNDHDLETELMVQRMARRMKRADDVKAIEAIYDLDDRVGFLLGQQDHPDEANPFSPEAVCTAIRLAFEEISREPPVNRELLRAFEPQLAPAFYPAYQAINARLVSYNVIPNMAAYRRERRAARVSAARTHGAPTPRHEDAGANETAPQSPTDSLFERYARYRATRPEPLSESMAGPPDTFWPASYRPILEQLPSLVPSSPAVAAALSGMVAVPLLDLNVLHQVRDNAKRSGASRDEELLIDLVALLLDRILQDRQTPERIKRLIARLQVPLLKAALIDRRLFAQSHHPTRQFIDAIADTASGRPEADDPNSAYYQLIVSAISDVETHFQRDFAVFSTAAEKIRAFNAQELARESRRHERATALLQRIEQREMADMQVLMHIRDAVAGIELPEEVTEFLLEPWRKVLVESRVAGAPDSTLATFQKAITDLVWSLQPKVDLAERQRLVQLLPQLLKTLRSGLLTISWPADKEDAFFALLMQLHSHAVRIGQRTEWQERAFEQFAARMQTLPETNTLDPAAAGLGPESLDISPLQLATTIVRNKVHLTVATQPPSEDRATSLGLSRVEAADAVAQMTPGSWIEFKEDGVARQLKLRWMSPLRTFLLFTDSAGQNAITFTPDLLRGHLENATATLLGNKALTERALGSIEATIDAA